MQKSYMKWDQENMLMSFMKNKNSKKIKKLMDHKNRSKRIVKDLQSIVLKKIKRRNRKC